MGALRFEITLPGGGFFILINVPSKRIWIFVNGCLAQPERLRTFFQPVDRLIAADGGQRYLEQLGLRAERVIGDLDSLSAVELAQFQAHGGIVERYPTEKDETDLELALEWALRQNPTDIRIAAALGGRLDQTLGNLSLLTRPDLATLDVRLEDGHEEVFLIRAERSITGQVGETVSLLPWGGPANGVSTQGLQYPLRGETLYPERTRGISNVMTAPQAWVRLDGGLLICVHTHQ